MTTETPTFTIGAPPRDPFHRYTWQGRDLPSWSTLRSTAGMKPQLHAWALRGMADMAVEMGLVLGAAVENGDEAAVSWARERLWDAAVEAQGAKARLGTAVHEAAHRGDDPGTPDVADHLRQDRAFLAHTRATIVASEFTIYNLAVGYGGTADRLLLMPDGGLWLVDIKTGSLWGEHLLQVTGYAMGEFVAVGDQVDERTTAMLHGLSGVAVLQLTPEAWEFRTLRIDARAWSAFRGLAAFAGWLHDHDDIDTVTASVIGGRA